MLIPIITKENIKNLNTNIKDDFGNETTKGIFHIFCKKHNIYFDCRIGCLLCYKECDKAIEKIGF